MGNVSKKEAEEAKKEAALKAAEEAKRFKRARVKKGWDSRPCLASDVEMYKKLGFVEVK
jgi:hypothetical protein